MKSQEKRQASRPLKGRKAKRTKRWSEKEDKVLFSAIAEMGNTAFVHRLSSLRLKWSLGVNRTESSCRLRVLRITDPSIRFSRKPPRLTAGERFNSLGFKQMTHYFNRMKGKYTLSNSLVEQESGGFIVSVNVIKEQSVVYFKSVNFEQKVSDRILKDALNYLSITIMIELMGIGIDNLNT